MTMPESARTSREPHVICILTGGPMHRISVNGKIYEFEMHPCCGPTLLNRNGDPLKHQPTSFLEAASLWAQQGRRIEDGLCRWDHEPKPILRRSSLEIRWRTSTQKGIIMTPHGLTPIPGNGWTMNGRTHPLPSAHMAVTGKSGDGRRITRANRK